MQEEREAVEDIISRISTTLQDAIYLAIDIDEILSTLTEELINLPNYHIVVIYLLDVTTENLILKNYSIKPGAIEKLEGLPVKSFIGQKIPLVEGSPLGKAINEKAPVYTTDMGEVVKSHFDQRWIGPFAKGVGGIMRLNSGIAIPLLAEDRAIGVLTVGSRGILDRGECEELSAFGKHVGYLIDRVGTYLRLKKLAGRYKELFESINDAVVTIDLNGNLTSANRIAEKISGYTRAELIGQQIHLLVLPEYMAELMELVKNQGTKDLFTATYELFIINKMGAKVPIEATFSLMTEDGKLTGYQVIARDITERKRMEQEIREAKEYLELVTRGAPSGLFTLDTKGIVRYWNREAELITGYPARDVVGKRCPFFEGEPCSRECVLYNDTIKKPIYNKECKIETKDGKILFISKSLDLIRGEKGKVIGGVESFINLTELKTMADEVRNYADSLEKTSHIKDLFIDIIDHDLMNKVSVIRGFTEIIRQEDIPEETKAELEAVEDITLKLEEMIYGATTMSRLGTIKEVSTTESDLIPMIKEVIGELKHEAEKKKIDVKFSSEGSAIAPVNMFMKDVFLNLISNAIKYSPEGGKVIVGLSDQGSFFRFKVIDNGEGVPDGYKEDIFNRFERIEKRGVKGTGLGLAIVKRLMEFHKGYAGVIDNPQGGSIFFVDIKKGEL